MNSWTAAVRGLLLLGLCCLVAQKARWCQCAPPPDNGGSNPQATVVLLDPAEPEQRDKLLKTTEKPDCTMEFFSRYRPQTAGSYANNHASAKDLHRRLAECAFVDDFKQRLADLGDDDRAKLASLADNIKRGKKEAFISSGTRWGNPPDVYSEGVLGFLGEQGVFVSGRELGASDLSREFSQKVESLCRRVQAALEPTAEIFRLFSDAQVRAQVFPEVDESLFNWADASKLCHTVALSRPSKGTICDYAAYVAAFEAGRLPGDPRWEEAKAKFEQRVDVALVAADIDDDGCELFRRFDSIVGEMSNYRRWSEEQDSSSSLRNRRKEFLSQCKATFHREFRQTIAKLDPSEAAQAVALVGAIYGKEPLGSYLHDIDRGTLQFMKQRDKSVFRLWRKLNREQFNKKYDQLVKNLSLSITHSFAPVVKEFSKYLTDEQLTDTTDESLLDWVHRWNMLNRLLRPSTKEDVYEAYKLGRLGSILRGA